MSGYPKPCNRPCQAYCAAQRVFGFLQERIKKTAPRTVRLADNNAADNERFAGFHGAQSDCNARQNQEPLRSKGLCASKRNAALLPAPRSIRFVPGQLSEAR